MADEGISLDAFVTTPEAKDQQETVVETVNLEDEFAKLLNDFIAQEAKPSTPKAPETSSDSIGGLDSFISSANNPLKDETQSNSPINEGLDSFITPSHNSKENQAPKEEIESLDGFITPTTAAPNQQSNDAGLDSFITPEQTSSNASSATASSGLKAEEFELARAISNFQDGIHSLANKKNLKAPITEYTEKMLEPNYKPSVGRKIAQYMLDCWDLINKADPENMKRLSKNANDEEYLAFAETLSDTDMQLAIISYVEILINLEICEVKYEQKKEIIQKNRIKKELYEEYMELQNRKEIFIQKLKEKNFPIDVDRLINNYFRVAQKDPDGAFDALVKNPAMFAPIQVEKIRPKFFGLIKVTPEDGIKVNQKIGKFIKNLKV